MPTDGVSADPGPGSALGLRQPARLGKCMVQLGYTSAHAGADTITACAHARFPSDGVTTTGSRIDTRAFFRTLLGDRDADDDPDDDDD